MRLCQCGGVGGGRLFSIQKATFLAEGNKGFEIMIFMVAISKADSIKNTNTQKNLNEKLVSALNTATHFTGIQVKRVAVSKAESIKF